MKAIVTFLICFFAAVASLYIYMNQVNELTKVRLEIPQLKKELKVLREENNRLQYEIDQFENPMHLIELSRKNEFSHLKYPKRDEVIIIEE